MQYFRFILQVMFLGCFFGVRGVPVSHELAINTMQVEICKHEIAKKNTEFLNFGSTKITYVSIALLALAIISKSSRWGLIKTLFVLNIPRLWWHLFIRYPNDRQIGFIREQIERLQQEEMQLS